MATKEVEIMKDLPKKEKVWVRQYSLSGREFVVTAPPDRSIHNLWEVFDGGYQFITKAKSPYDLYDKINDLTADKSKSKTAKKKLDR